MTAIYSALFDFQQELTTVGKTAENPFFKSAYAPLPEILKTVQPVLAKHGLGITQFPSQTTEGKPALTTILFHKDGETIEHTSPIILSKTDPQAQGSAITYMRRYGYAAVTQIVIDEDDDGNKASGDPEFHTTYVTNNIQTPPQQIKAEHLSGAITDTPIDDETFKELNFLPGNLNLPKEVSKEVWNRLYQLGVYRGKFDFAGTKTWSGTKISKSQIPLIVKAFAKAANYDEEQTRILVQQFVGDEQTDTPADLADYSDEIF